jgi:ATP-dependent protease ClpP protease subunit
MAYSNQGDRKMARHITILTAVLLSCVALCTADTFKHRQTGEVFHGFTTQKSIGNRTRVYNADLKSFKPIVMAEYDVTVNAEGRHNSVIVIPIKQGEVLLSEVVSRTLAEAIVEASNKGPRFIVIEIDNPGGRGEYMKNITTAITQTNNCPIIAYISGGEFGGVYSAATAIAMACEKIYIAPVAIMGAVAPSTGTAAGYEDGQKDLDIYSPENLSAYNSFIAALADKYNRPAALAMAMLDRHVEVIEVADRSGNKTFISGADRKPDQSVVRTLTRTTGRSGESVLTLTPTDAVDSGMADKVVGSLAQLLTDMGAAGADLAKSGQVDKTIRKFLAAKRNLSEVIASADYLKKRADELEIQLNEREKQTLQDTRQLEYRRGDSDRGYSYGRGTRGTRSDGFPRNNTRRGRGRQTETEIVSGSEPVVDTLRLRNELASVLTDLVREYNRAIALARRWPGALPADVTIQSLEQKQTTARALHNDIVFRRSGGFAPNTPLDPASRFNRPAPYIR